MYWLDLSLWTIGIFLITWFIMGDMPEKEGSSCCLWYDVFMKDSMYANGLSFRLLEDGSLLLTTPTGQYQIQPQGVSDLYDLLGASEARFLGATPDLPMWAKGTNGRTVLGSVHINEETQSQSLDLYREEQEES